MSSRRRPSRWQRDLRPEPLSLPYPRVRVKPPLKDHGSCRLLAGLTGQIVAHHEIQGWVKVQLDPNDRIAEREWSIPFERLDPL